MSEKKMPKSITIGECISLINLCRQVIEDNGGHDIRFKPEKKQEEKEDGNELRPTIPGIEVTDCEVDN